MQTHPGRQSFAALFLALALAGVGTGCTPSGPKALLQGAELLRKGNYEAAIAKLVIAKEMLPGNARAWNYLGLAYHGVGQYGEAIIHYQRAQELDKDLAEARYNLGELFLEQGNPVSAADELTVFTALRPKSVEGWVRLGDAHLQNQRADRAQTSYYTALNLKRETPEAFNGLGLILLQRKNPRDAYRYFVEANKYDPNYAPAILNMAVVAQAHLNSPPTALAKYREYLAKAPEAPNAADVRVAIRQLDAIVNARPEPPKPAPEPVVEAVAATVHSNAAVNATASTASVTNRSTITAPTPKTNTTHVVTPRTNAPNVAVVTSNRTQSARGSEVVPTPLTASKPATPITTPDRSRNPAPSDKPLTSIPTAGGDKPPGLAEITKPVAAPEPVAETQPAKVADEPPLEVVQIETAQIQPAVDITPATEIQPNQTAPVPAPGSGEVAQPVAQETLPQLEREEVTGKEKRGFFQRINPVNLFRSEKRESAPKPPAEIVTPLPPDTSVSTDPTPAPAPTVVANANRLDVTPIPGPPTAPRYQYGRNKKPVAGDRAAAERLFERGLAAQTRRDPSSAASFFSAAIAADATYFPAYYNLGLVGYSSGQWYGALSAFETALVLDPNSAEARYNFALTLQKARFPIDSARELERLLEQKPADTRAMLLLGNVYAQDLDNADEARKRYQQLLSQEPQHPQATAIRYWLAEHP